MSQIVTLVADRRARTLSEGIINAVRDALGGSAVDILSPGEAADILVHGPLDEPALAAALAGESIDAVVTKTRGRRKGLLIADMDSTIVTSETLDEIADFAGLKDVIAAITQRSMNGEIDFAGALRARVAMLEGLDLDALEQTWARTLITEGAAELVATMRAHNALTALVSGGFTFFTARVAARLGFDVHRANTLLDDGKALTGGVGEPILDRDAKLATLRELAEARGIRLAAALAVGDGANDLGMIREAGLGVAYHAKPVVAAEAKARIEHASLRALLFIQGYHIAEIVTS